MMINSYERDKCKIVPVHTLRAVEYHYISKNTIVQLRLCIRQEKVLKRPFCIQTILKNEVQIFLLHLTHMIHHEFRIVPLYLSLLLPGKKIVQILRKKSSLSWTTVACVHDIHDLVWTKPTKPQLNYLRLLRIIKH